jgi:hypothetical protein
MMSQTCTATAVHCVPVAHRYHEGVSRAVSLLNLERPKVNAAFLHIRGGDYRGHPIHGLPMEGYYERAIKHFPSDTLFYVLTNDREYAESFAVLKTIRHEYIDCDEIEGLAWMKRCTLGGICPNSTYSWWGAVQDLNRTLVIPSQWTNDLAWSALSNYRFPGVIVEDVPLDVYCIHLAHRSDRMQHIQSIRARYSSFRIHVVDAIRDEDGHRGCILSHKKVIADAKARRLPYVIVMEDDCSFLLPESQLLSSFRAIISYMMTHPDVDIINGCGNLPTLTASVVDAQNGVQLLKAPDVRTTHCMVYSSRAYDHFLGISERMPIDIQTNEFSMLFTYPYLATQLPSYSDIEHKDVAYENIARSHAFVKEILEGRLPNQVLNQRVNPLSVLRIPIRTNRV